MVDYKKQFNDFFGGMCKAQGSEVTPQTPVKHPPNRDMEDDDDEDYPFREIDGGNPRHNEDDWREDR